MQATAQLAIVGQAIELVRLCHLGEQVRHKRLAVMGQHLNAAQQTAAHLTAQGAIFMPVLLIQQLVPDSSGHAAAHHAEKVSLVTDDVCPAVEQIALDDFYSHR